MQCVQLSPESKGVPSGQMEPGPLDCRASSQVLAHSTSVLRMYVLCAAPSPQCGALLGKVLNAGLIEVMDASTLYCAYSYPGSMMVDWILVVVRKEA
jgi:hypothetical protein